MYLRKQLLHYMLDIGGVLTLNNLYSLNALDYKGSLVQPRKCLKFWLENKFVKPIIPYYKPQDPVNQVFYRITSKGAEFIGRKDEYKKVTKSPSIRNVEHESCKFDVLMAFLRLFPDFEITISFPCYKGCKPDAFVVMKKGDRDYNFYIEVERKDKLYRPSEKIAKYDKLKRGEGGVPKFYKVLIVFSHSRNYKCFLRPQQYSLYPKLIEENIQATQKLPRAYQYPDNFFFLPQSQVYRLNQPVMYNHKGIRT